MNDQTIHSGMGMMSVHQKVRDNSLLIKHLEKEGLVAVINNGDDVIAAPGYLFPGTDAEQSVLHGVGRSSYLVNTIPIGMLTFIDMEELNDPDL